MKGGYYLCHMDTGSMVGLVEAAVVIHAVILDDLSLITAASMEAMEVMEDMVTVAFVDMGVTVDMGVMVAFMEVFLSVVLDEQSVQ